MEEFRMRLRLKLATILIGTAGLLVPLAGVASAQVSLTPQATTTTPTCTVTASPTSFVETGEGASASSVAFVIIVECKPVYSEQQVQINATQLSNACQGTLSWYSATATAGTGPDTGTGPEFVVTLDNDGDATAVVWCGPSCAATKDLITADLMTAPFTTARTHVTIEPPTTTTKGLYPYPASEVEDATTSSVAVIFYAEFPSVYAARTVELATPSYSTVAQAASHGSAPMRSSSAPASPRPPRSTTMATRSWWHWPARPALRARRSPKST
jgi:hypothetical protein